MTWIWGVNDNFEARNAIVRQHQETEFRGILELERAAGIEPASLAWKAKVLPLHNARADIGLLHRFGMVKGIGHCV